MEAARIPWRPLGRLLVEQGLLSGDELERALEQQEQTGRRLGETLVECGFVSGPELSHALAAQYGIELTAETGFGTGLRTEIQRRHETERRGFRPALSAVDPVDPATDVDAEPEAAVELEESAQAVQAQLEEQWAKLAAAEERLAESHRELTALAHEYDERRSQATRLARRARHAREQLGSRHVHDGRFAQLENEVRGREAEIDRLRSECVDLRGQLAGAEAAAEGRLGESHRELVALAREYDRRHSQAARLARHARHARGKLGLQRERDGRIEQLERDARDRGAEIDRVRDGLAGAEAAVAERDRLLEDLRRKAQRRRGQAVRFLERARASTTSEEQLRTSLTTVEDQLAESQHELASQHERDERIAAEIDRLRDGLAGAEAAVAERDRLLEDLRRKAQRRRGQAVRFLERARKSTAGEEQLRASLMVVEEHLVESRRELDELAREHVYRRNQAKRFAQHARQIGEQLGSQHDRDERIAQLEDDVRGRDAELDRVHEERERQAAASEEQLTAAEERLLDSRRELASERERRRSQLARFIRRVRERDARIERLAADVRGCDAELDRLRHELETRLRAQVALPAPPTPPASHLVFVHLAGRYELVEQAGPPPARNTVLVLPELHGGPLVVAGLARSPLPGDARPCAFLTPAP